MQYSEKQIKYSIVLLLEEESEEIGLFVSRIHKLFVEKYKSFEIIIIINGIEGVFKEELSELKNEFPHIKIYTFYRKNTQAVCMKAALQESQGSIIIACGSYQQITMSGLDQTIGSLDDQTDMVLPCRKNRIDPSFNQFQSFVFNELVRIITGYYFNDLSCTVRIIRREVFESIDFYGNMYRFLPVVAAKKGFKYKEIDTDHFSEMGKTGLYSLSEYFFRVIDIISLLFLVQYIKKPFRFFSKIGSVFAILGMCVVCYVIINRIFFNVLTGNNFVLIMGFLLIIVGVQSAGTGLLGEMITFAHGRKQKEYNIDRIVCKSFNLKAKWNSIDRRKNMERRK